MASTLASLKQRIEKMIEERGANSPVAAFIFTEDDVTGAEEDSDDYDDYIDYISIVDGGLSTQDVDDVLTEIENNEWIIEQINNRIEDEIKDIKKRKAKYNNDLITIIE